MPNLTLRSLFVFFLLTISFLSISQIIPPACPNSLVIMHTSPISVYNTSLPLSATNPSNTGIPLGGTGLSYGPNLNAAFPNPTYYTTIAGNMNWWDGTSWINTGHSMPVVNLGGGGSFIYGLNGGTGQIWVYNGTGPATLLMTIATFGGGGPYDVVADNCGNFYILKTTPPQSMTMYGPTGNQLCTYNMTGMPNISAGGGFAIVNGQVIVSNTGGLYTGDIIGTTISFTNTSANGYGAGDFASCPLPCGPLIVTASNTSSSTPLGCSSGTANVFAVTALSPVTYNWSGPGIVSGSTSSVALVNAPGVYSCTVIQAGCPSQTTVATTTVIGTSTFVATANSQGPITCNNSTSQLTANPAPPNHSYLWSGPGIVGANNTQTINVNVSGVYTTTVTNTITGCIGIATISVVSSLIPPTLIINPISSSICSGSSVNISAAGANSYSWSPSIGLNTTTGPSVIANPAVTTTYNVVGSVGSCTNSAISVITINPQPIITATPFNSICGNSNGSLIINNISPAGQTVISFSLNGSSINSQTVTGLPAGNYTLAVTNNFGCTFSTNTTINNTSGVSNLGTTIVNPSCGGTNGLITLGAVTGGSGPYLYSINGGPYLASPPLTNLTGGTYTLSVQDINNCVFTKTLTLINTSAPTAISFTTLPTACIGNTGILGITGVTGGTPAYSFTVNGVATNSVTNNLSVGPKTITVSDANGCTYSTTVVIPIVSGPAAATIAVTAAACGNSNGSATLTNVTGGLSPYQYAFNNGPFAVTNIQSGMLAGPHSVIIQDANSCTLTVNFIIGNTGSPNSSITTLTNISCFNGSNGGFNITTSGGTPGYSYTLTPGNITSGFGVFTNLTAQAYTINVSDALGCVTTLTTTINQPSPLTLSLNAIQPACNGGNNGTITAIAGSGTGPYLFNINGGLNQSNSSFTSNISAGAYNVTLIDNLGCTLSQTIVVTQPPPISLTLTSVPANCSSANGSASVSASGGTPIYSYTWSPTGINNSNALGIASGLYTVTVKDTKNCTVNGVVSVGAIPGGTAVISNIINVTCNGSANGSLTANMLGNFTAPLTYSWSNGSNLQTAGPLAPGNYSVSISDFYGCEASAVGTITQPSPITLITAVSPVLCFGGSTGSASVIASGGTSGYTYLWSPNGSTTSVVSGLSAGTYSLMVTDANNCVQNSSITINQPSPVTITTNTLTAACNQSNGVASATATGGTPAYTYTWSTGFAGQTITNVPAGTYTVQVQDANGCLYLLAATVPNASGPSIGIASFTNPSCYGGSNGIATTTITAGTPGPGFPIYNWSNGQNTGTATNLLNGVYTVTLTDAVGCKASASVTIVQPSFLTINVSGINPKCFNATNGSANVGVLGGTAPYNYSWLPLPGAGGTTSAPSSMGPGNYNVTITDNNGCIKQGSITLTNPAQMLSSINFTHVTCFNACNGLATASTTNAIGAVSYYWTGGSLPSSTQNVSNLCAGTYTMLATDQNLCTASSVVSILQPSLLTVSISAIGTPSCFGYSNGFATATPNGGTPGYTYSWSNGQTSATSANLLAGSYTITVSDSKSCTANAVAIVNQPTGLTVVATKTNAPCFGGFGIGNVNYSGGTGLPSILWQPNLALTQYVNNLVASTVPYTVTLTDVNGCSISTTLTITQPTQLAANITTVIPTNCGQSNGSSAVMASGGAGGYTYQWTSNPTFTNASITGVPAQAYSVTVTDINNCAVTTATIIPNIAAPSVVVTNTTPVVCFGQANGGATISVSGGAGGNTYLWSYLAQTSPNVSNLPFGLHSVTVVDAAGCLGGAIVNITQPGQLVTAIGSVTNVSCASFANGAAQMLTTGGTANYTYLWQPSAQTNSILTGVTSGVYSCTITDVNGCVSSKTISITQPSPLLISTNTVIPNNCFGFASGQINTSITGGTPTYSINWLPIQTPNPVITNLTSGTYSMAVVDNNGCSTFSVYTLIDPSALVILATTTTQATCGNSNGTANVTISGGSPSYSYNWNTSNLQNTSSATGLPAGTWSLTTTDSKGCVIVASVTINAATLPSVSAVSNSIICFGQSNGSATLTPSGVGGFTYNWSPSGLTSAIVNGLGPAIYSATVTDANGCKTYTTVTINQPNVLIANTSPIQTICFGKIGSVYAQASGGSSPYNYTLTNITSNNSLTLSTPNGINTIDTFTATSQYQVIVTDNNNCSFGPVSILVNVTPKLLASGKTFTVCDKDKINLSPVITSPGNGGPYSYIWSNNTFSQNALITANYSASNPNSFSVTITDGCTIPDAKAEFTVFVNPLPQITFTPSIIKGCAPLTINFEASSNNPNYDTSNDSFYWNFGNSANNGGGPELANPISTTYSEVGSYAIQLTVKNDFGCTKDSVTNKIIDVYPLPIADFIPDPPTTTLLESTINFQNISKGATAYNWDFGDYASTNNGSNAMNPSYTYSLIGTYTVYLAAINSYGCKDTAVRTIDITPYMKIYIPNAFTPDGNGRNEMFIPYGIGVNEKNYQMEIFDRWGELIFSSTEFEKGWNGTIKGTKTIAKDGVYIYKIMITDLENNKKNYIGHVTLLKQ